METAIRIGVDGGTVKVARDTVMEILKFDRPDDVILAALKAFTHVCNVDHTTISNCVFKLGEQTKRRKPRTTT